MRFFVFKQKTAYEMLRSLVGSEMCIRDRHVQVLYRRTRAEMPAEDIEIEEAEEEGVEFTYLAVSYTHLTLPTIYSV